MGRSVYSDQRIDALLGKLRPHLRRQFIDALIAIKDEWTLEELAKLISEGRIQQAMDVVRREMAQFARSVTQGFQLSGQGVAVFASEHLGVPIRFQPYDDRAVRFVRDNEIKLVGGMSRGQEQTIRQALADGVRRGLNPREQARNFRSVLGLTPSQHESVLNYRRLLEQNSAEALHRELRDGRFDSKLRRAIEMDRPLSQSEIDRMVNRYSENTVSYHSEVIARSESLRAVHEGAEEGFKQLVEGGRVPKQDVNREWISTGDDRTRASHDEMDGQIVALGEPFITGLGNRLRYPGDPSAPLYETAQCRCSVATVIEFNRTKIAMIHECCGRAPEMLMAA